MRMGDIGPEVVHYEVLPVRDDAAVVPVEQAVELAAPEPAEFEPAR